MKSLMHLNSVSIIVPMATEKQVKSLRQSIFLRGALSRSSSEVKYCKLGKYLVLDTGVFVDLKKKNGIYEMMYKY